MKQQRHIVRRLRQIRRRQSSDAVGLMRSDDISVVTFASHWLKFGVKGCRGEIELAGRDLQSGYKVRKDEAKTYG